MVRMNRTHAGNMTNYLIIILSDYNFIRNGDICVPAGPEPIPADVCRDPNGTYLGSSGYRLIPGNTCDKSKGTVKDDPVRKDCSQGLRIFSGGRKTSLPSFLLAQPEEGQITHQMVSSSCVAGFRT